jgi:hypothetical protein
MTLTIIWGSRTGQGHHVVRQESVFLENKWKGKQSVTRPRQREREIYDRRIATLGTLQLPENYSISLAYPRLHSTHALHSLRTKLKVRQQSVVTYRGLSISPTSSLTNGRECWTMVAFPFDSSWDFHFSQIIDFCYDKNTKYQTPNSFFFFFSIISHSPDRQTRIAIDFRQSLVCQVLMYNSALVWTFHRF